MTTPAPPHFWTFSTGGTLLAFSAGFVNVVTVLSPNHITASHVTGTVTRLAADTVGLDDRTRNLALATMVAFFLGAALVGATLDSTRLAFGRRYGILLLGEAAVLALAARLLAGGDDRGVVLAAGACGLQNALATHYSQAIVRTSHVTGIVTDLGIALGKLVGRRGVDGWRVALYLGLLAGFAAGGTLGAGAYLRHGGAALYAPAAVVGVLGVGYKLVRLVERRTSTADATGDTR